MGEGSATRSVELSIEGMHCGSCSALIEETLADTAGVGRAEVSLEAGRARVSFDPKAMSVSRLCELVTEVGYPARPLADQPPEC